MAQLGANNGSDVEINGQCISSFSRPATWQSRLRVRLLLSWSLFRPHSTQRGIPSWRGGMVADSPAAGGGALGGGG